MAIDLAKCIGCDACSVACKIENSSPGEIWWAPVVKTEVGKFPNARRSFLPLLCMHCEDPPCLKSCPTKSISQRDDGIVVIDEKRCAGSKACVSACPYNAITVWEEGTPLYENAPSPIDELAKEKHRFGAAQKCTFCVHRMDLAKEKSLRPGVDREATPACVLACPAECRIFGNVEDSESPVSRYIDKANEKSRKVFSLNPEARTRPQVVYVW